MSVATASAQNSVSPVQGEVHLQTSGIALLVIDPLGAVIGTARIVLKNEADQVVAKGATNQEGWLTLSGFQGSPYFIEVSAPGFQTHREKVILQPRIVTNITVKLEVAATQGVIVRGDSAPVLVVDGMSTPIEINLQPLSPIPAPTRRVSAFKRFFAKVFHKS